MKVRCISDYIMDDGGRAFTTGKTYEASRRRMDGHVFVDDGGDDHIMSHWHLFQQDGGHFVEVDG